MGACYLLTVFTNIFTEHSAHGHTQHFLFNASEFLPFLQLRRPTRSSLELTNWWRSSYDRRRSGHHLINAQLTRRTTSQSEAWTLLGGFYTLLLWAFFVHCVQLKTNASVHGSEFWALFLVFQGSGWQVVTASTVTCRLIFVIVSPHQLLSDHYSPPNSRSQSLFPLVERVEHQLVRVRMCMGVYTRTLCSCKAQRWREKSSGRGDHNGVGVTFICTQNGVCVGPGPPSLILYQLTATPHPQTHTHTNTAEEETDSRLTLFFFVSLLLLSPSLLLCSLCCLEIYCIPPAEHFLNYRFEVP